MRVVSAGHARSCCSLRVPQRCAHLFRRFQLRRRGQVLREQRSPGGECHALPNGRHRTTHWPSWWDQSQELSRYDLKVLKRSWVWRVVLCAWSFVLCSKLQHKNCFESVKRTAE